jgi:hypothetical protein
LGDSAKVWMNWICVVHLHKHSIFHGKSRGFSKAAGATLVNRLYPSSWHGYGWTEIADSAYAKAIYFAPNTRAAYAGRLRLAEAHGRTAKAQEIQTEIVRLWPDDDHERNHEMYLRLLLGASGADAEKAVREGEILAAREPLQLAGARGDARNLRAEHLLPEERALIAPLLMD